MNLLPMVFTYLKFPFKLFMTWNISAVLFLHESPFCCSVVLVLKMILFKVLFLDSNFGLPVHTEKWSSGYGKANFPPIYSFGKLNWTLRISTILDLKKKQKKLFWIRQESKHICKFKSISDKFFWNLNFYFITSNKTYCVVYIVSSQVVIYKSFYDPFSYVSG